MNVLVPAIVCVVELISPLAVAEASGILNVCTVPALTILKSVPVVPVAKVWSDERANPLIVRVLGTPPNPDIVYVGMLRTSATNVADPELPVVVKVIAFCLALNVLQSVELKAPLLIADAVGTFRVITGVVVLLATVELRSVPVVPIVRAATDVTVPTYWSLDVIVKLG